MKHRVIDIHFTNKDGSDDVTQFDFHGDWDDVMETWQGFCDAEGLAFESFGGFDIYEVDEPDYIEDDRAFIPYNVCPHCGGYDDWSCIEWDDPYDAEYTAFATCPHCGKLHKLVYTLTEHVAVEG